MQFLEGPTPPLIRGWGRGPTMCNLDISKVRDNRVFWKIVKLKISDMVKIRSKITLVEDDKILSQDAEIAKTFKKRYPHQHGMI